MDSYALRVVMSLFNEAHGRGSQSGCHARVMQSRIRSRVRIPHISFSRFDTRHQLPLETLCARAPSGAFPSNREPVALAVPSPAAEEIAAKVN